MKLEIKKESLFKRRLLNDWPRLARERNCLHSEGSFFIPTKVDGESPEAIIPRVYLHTFDGDRCTEEASARTSFCFHKTCSVRTSYCRSDEVRCSLLPPKLLEESRGQ